MYNLATEERETENWAVTDSTFGALLSQALKSHSDAFHPCRQLHGKAPWDWRAASFLNAVLLCRCLFV